MGNAPPARQNAPLADSAYKANSFRSLLAASVGYLSSFPWEKDIQRFEKFLIIWLDSKVDRNNRIQMAIESLENRVQRTVKMKNYYECMRWLVNYDADEKILFIVSNEFDQTHMLDFHRFPSIIAIYKYSLDHKIGDTWAHTYPNVRDIVIDLDTLVQIILQDLACFKRIDDFNERRLHSSLRVRYMKTLKTMKYMTEDEPAHTGIEKYFEEIIRTKSIVFFRFSI